MSRPHFIVRSGDARLTKAESGMTLVEVMLAITVLAVGAFSALSTLTSSSALDEELKARGIALRAAITRIESVAAYDYDDDIDNLVNYWSQPANATFAVDGLAAPSGVAQHGAVTFDTTDPERIVVTVTVSWSTRKGEARSLSLPLILTEVID